MASDIVSKIFGSKHDRDIKKIQPIVQEINRIYESYHSLSDEELKGKTEEFRRRIEERVGETRAELDKLHGFLTQDVQEETDGVSAESIRRQVEALEKQELEELAEILDELLPEAFAAVKETCRRLVGQRWKVVEQEIEWDMIPFDVQLIGAVVLHQGKIAEMATGEGKTLVASMPMYLNALAGKGVHLVTVNDYLARRDCEWMGKIYENLGLTIRYITNDMPPEVRREAYLADITYGTNNEFGFDYLRDNMSIRGEDQVQRRHHYAIVDEVDSVLVDEARTPLIISGPVEQSTQRFGEVKPSVEHLIRSQTRLVNSIVAEAEKKLEEEEYEAGIMLLRASRGAPKNKRLTKLMQEPGIKKLIRGVENDFMRDKRMHEIDEELYFSIDEKSHIVDLTEKGHAALSPNDPDMFVLPEMSETLVALDEDERLTLEQKEQKKESLHREYNEKSERIHNIAQMLKAYSLFEKDVEYVVQDGKVLIVDEFTGRLMPGRRFSDGLHQALEAKENVQIERETQTLATITLQNYFRLYGKLAGMTGTAETEVTEFWEIYKLDVVVIPTNEPIRRMDYNDQVYRTKREKYNAVIEEIARMHERRRPVLVGTITVEVSETLSRMLKRRGIPHSVLNAKHHQQEADIVRRAGQPGAVTIATNMAGRGTDIKLGPGVVRCQEGCYLVDDQGRQVPADIDLRECQADMPCGLHIMGTERHESRRIDRQLRGRSGRQGDPGSSTFYLSLEDDLMRLFASERIAGIMDRLGAEEGEVIEHRMVTKSIERAQKRVESRNFDIRKHLLEYDDVMNQQREVIYSRRNNALSGENLRDEIMEMIDSHIEHVIEQHTGGADYSEDWDWSGMETQLRKNMFVDLQVSPDDRANISREELFARIREKAVEAYQRKEEVYGEHNMRQLERFAMLRVIDEQWKEHLYEMDNLKEGIGLRAYGQKDPLIEYKSEGFRAFSEMLNQIDEQVLELAFRAQLTVEPPVPARMPRRMVAQHREAAGMGFASGPPEPEAATAGKRQPVTADPKIGRNDPCPCGSGKKYKKCHGA